MCRLSVPALLACVLAGANSGQEWVRLGPDGGMVTSLGQGGAGSVYLGTADGHVFASDDGASTWELRGRVGNRLDAVVTRLLVDSVDERQLMAGVWFRGAAENGGVFRSQDGGHTWRPSGLEGEAVRALERARSKPTFVVAGTRTGIFLSRDGGKSWDRISPEGDPELRNVDSIAIDPRDPNVIYVGTYHLPWKTKDGGKSWEPIIAGIIDDSDIMSLRLDSTNPDRIYMSACSGIYRSENQGAQWTKLQGIPYAARRTQTMVQDSGNPKMFYAGTTEGAWVTRDSGETWTRTTSRDWVVNSVVILTTDPLHPGRIVMGTDAGIQVSDDHGENFAPSNRGFRHVIVKELVAGFGGSNEILALVQRNGWELLESTDQGKDWSPVALALAPPGKSELNPDQIRNVLGSPWGWMLQMADGRFWMRDGQGVWQRWKPRPRPESGSSNISRPIRGASIHPFANEIEPGVVSFSADSATITWDKGVAQCNKKGLCKMLGAFGAGRVIDLWISRTGNQLAIVQDRKLGVSSDGGATAGWHDLPSGEPLWIRGEERRASDGKGVKKVQQILVLGTSAGLFVSQDEGARWTPIMSGLPAGRMERWLAGPAFWVVSEQSGGLYLSTADGMSWTRIDQDAERGRFAGFVKIGESKVLAGSISEGILQVTIP